MTMTRGTAGVIGLSVLFTAWFAYGQPKPSEEKERKVKESEVPAAALAALKKSAADHKLTQIEEEIEHGHKFYEGQWMGPDGKVEVLVTESGDVVEIEEIVPADKVPSAVRAAAENDAGKGAKLVFEKKTAVTYEIHFKKEGKKQEISYEPTGTRQHQEAKGDEDNDDD